MNREVVALFLLGLVVLTVGLPVTKTEKKEEGKDAAKTNEEHGIKYDEGYAEDDPRNRPDVISNSIYTYSCFIKSILIPFQMQLEYSKYLQEVVSALENDPDFRAKLDKADEADIRVRRNWQRVLCLACGRKNLSSRINTSPRIE